MRFEKMRFQGRGYRLTFWHSGPLWKILMRKMFRLWAPGKGESGDMLCLKTRLESWVCIYATHIFISGMDETAPRSGGVKVMVHRTKLNLAARD
jgi:hypothetical protein